MALPEGDMNAPVTRPICLFTDFGIGSPYVGQMQAVLAAAAPRCPVIALLSDAPAWRPDLAAYLLPALARDLPADAVLVCVVDPGVGTDRAALALEAEGRWYVGPDNGLLTVVARRAAAAQAWEIAWRPPRLSASFHGRDLFAPVAAELARGTLLTSRPRAVPVEDWPEDLAEIVYVDGYGNAITGVRAAVLGPDDVLRAGERRIARARTFCEVAPGAAFWYENANGLAEIAVNRGRAGRALGLGVGSEIFIEAGGGPATSR
jgi:hypothetical protein